MGTETGRTEASGHKEPTALKVRLNEPFTIQPDLLRSPIELDEDLQLLDTIQLDIEGLGKGSIEVLGDGASFDEELREKRFESAIYPIITPDGPIAVGTRYISDSEDYVEIDELPVRFVLRIGEGQLTQEQIDSMLVEINVNNKTFEGVSEIAIQKTEFDEDEEEDIEVEGIVDSLDMNETGSLVVRTVKVENIHDSAYIFVNNDSVGVRQVQFTIHHLLS